MLRNPWAARKAPSFGFSSWRTISASSPTGSGASSRNSTSRRDIRALSACSISRSRRRDGFMPAAAASTPSTSPNSLISRAAVFWPMPGIPGTLSTLSPISACTSTRRSGVTPNFSITSAGPIGFCLIGSSMSTPGRISCIRSLSEETMLVRPPILLTARA